VSDVLAFTEPFGENVRGFVGINAQSKDDLGRKFVRGPVKGDGANGAALKPAAGSFVEPAKGLSSDIQGPPV
jgi:hypothetical protein